MACLSNVGAASLSAASLRVSGVRWHDARTWMGRGASRGGGGQAGVRRSIHPPMVKGSRRDLQVRALDAAQPFDYEARAVARRKANEMQQLQAAKEAAKGPKLTIGIVGFGNFGQFIASRFVKQGHDVLGFSRGDYHAEAAAVGARYTQQMDDFCEEHPDVVVLGTSILSTANVLKSMPLQRLRRSTLFVDVLSVKAFPKALLLKELPENFDILCTHPMFGPESGKHSWEGLTFMYEKVREHGAQRMGNSAMSSEQRMDAFLRVWQDEGCNMVEMTCEEHDRLAASSQFITHTVGRVLGSMDLVSTPINTKGYESLLNIKSNTEKDSFDLYYGLFLYNQNATEELQRLEAAFADVKKELFGRLHDLVREDLLGVENVPSASAAAPAAAAAGAKLVNAGEVGEVGQTQGSD